MKTNAQLDRLYAEWKKTEKGYDKDDLLLKLVKMMERVGYGIIWGQFQEVDKEIVLSAVSSAVEDTMRRDRNNFKGKARFSSWFFQIVKFEFYRKIKKRKRRAEVPLEVAFEGGSPELENLAGGNGGLPPVSEKRNTHDIEQNRFDAEQAAQEARFTLEFISKGLTAQELELIELKRAGLTYEEISAFYKGNLTPRGAEARWNRLRRKLCAAHPDLIVGQ